MLDEEIPIKPLTDWKPETDVKLVKAFGKFTEEAGELQEAIGNVYQNTPSWKDIEDELADCDAMISLIEMASNNRIHIGKSEVPLGSTFTLIPDLCKYLGQAVKIVGRCQQQGISGSDPTTHVSNVRTLPNALMNLRFTIEAFIVVHRLDAERIKKRRDLKVKFKAPGSWVPPPI